MAHRSQGEHVCFLFYSIIKDMIKDRNKHLDEEIYRARSGKVISARASVSMVMDCVTFLLHGHVHQHRSSLNYCWDLYRGFIMWA